MLRRLRLSAARAAMIAAVSALTILTLPSAATAYVTTDMNDWNLTESLSYYGSNFSIASGTDGLVQYRWLDTPAKATVISAAACSDLSQLGSSAVIAVNSTSYYSLFSGSTGQCFVLRGRTTSGSGSLVNHDGRVKR